MKQLLILTFSLFYSLNSYCQNYTRDAGVRFGKGVTFNYRQYNDEINAYEFMASVSWRSFRFTALKEHFSPVFLQFSENINFYYGYGAHVGLNYSNRYEYFFRTYYMNRWKLSPLFGIDGIIGLEYNLGDLPVSFGFDFKPFFEFSTTRFFYIFLDNTSISFKYKF